MALDIKVGSITNAQRVKKMLVSNGYKASFHRLQNPQPGDGCGYAVMAKGDRNEILRIISSARIKILGVDEI